MNDPYEVLGLPADSDDETIRRRYLELVRQFSPEHHPEKFAAVRQAYESLRDLDTRLRHRLFEVGKKESVDALIEEITCRSPRRRLSLETLLGLLEEVLTPEGIEQVLGEFRAWLRESLAAGSLPAAPGAAPPDLHTLLGQLVALRQEVNLQTRATRGQQEQNAETLRQLTGALEALDRAQDLARQADRAGERELLRPLLKTLIDLHDALSVAAREVRRLQDVMVPALEELAAASTTAAELRRELRELLSPAPVPVPEARPSLWARLFGGGQERTGAGGADLDARRERIAGHLRRQEQTAQAAVRIDELLDSLLTGYRMSLQRIERALTQQGLEAIPSVGQPFDPERMEVVDVVPAEGRAGEVVAEVRRGYLWQGRVFREAQVSVAKG